MILLSKIEFQKLSDLVIDENCVRIYCVQHREAYKLQLRAKTPLMTKSFRLRNKKPPESNMLATATLSRVDLITLRDMIEKTLAEH